MIRRCDFRQRVPNGQQWSGWGLNLVDDVKSPPKSVVVVDAARSHTDVNCVSGLKRSQRPCEAQITRSIAKVAGGHRLVIHVNGDVQHMIQIPTARLGPLKPSSFNTVNAVVRNDKGGNRVMIEAISRLRLSVPGMPAIAVYFHEPERLM